VFTSKLNYTSQQSDVSGSATAGALVPNFATPTGTADGFTVQVTNYDESFTWSVSSAAGSPT
jgi:titin